MMEPLNSPIEVAIRVLALLDRSPGGYDVTKLTMLDHGLLHSADFGGPESLRPDLPVRIGELGMKRRRIEQGLAVLLRSDLAYMESHTSGLLYRATENARNFLGLLEAPYAKRVMTTANWVTDRLAQMSIEQLQELMLRNSGESTATTSGIYENKNGPLS